MGQINSNGEASRRISGLIGKNFFDDRLNVYAHAEYEKIDNVDSMDINWIRRAPIPFGDRRRTPTTAPYDGRLDATVFYGVNRLDILPWGQTTLANLQTAQQPDQSQHSLSKLASAVGTSPMPHCTATARKLRTYAGKTYVYDGANGRLANFGQRVGNVGINRPYKHRRRRHAVGRSGWLQPRSSVGIAALPSRHQLQDHGRNQLLTPKLNMSPKTPSCGVSGPSSTLIWTTIPTVPTTRTLSGAHRPSTCAGTTNAFPAAELEDGYRRQSH